MATGFSPEYWQKMLDADVQYRHFPNPPVFVLTESILVNECGHVVDVDKPRRARKPICLRSAARRSLMDYAFSLNAEGRFSKAQADMQMHVIYGFLRDRDDGFVADLSKDY